MIRIVLPYHLRNLAHVGGEVTLEVAPPVTQRSVLDALEARYPMLRGAIREHETLKRRAFLRFFACEEDLSHESPDAPLPDKTIFELGVPILGICFGVQLFAQFLVRGPSLRPGHRVPPRLLADDETGE